MILCDREIRERQDMIRPFNEEQLQIASYDLKLDHAERDSILPGESMLGVTKEYVVIPPDLVGLVYGKSSIAREFLNVHYAGFIDPGFKGQIVLEFTNNSDRTIKFDKFNTICQIAFIRMSDIPGELYGQKDNHYQNQRGIVRSWMEE